MRIINATLVFDDVYKSEIKNQCIRIDKGINPLLSDYNIRIFKRFKIGPLKNSNVVKLIEVCVLHESD